jgi:7-cyano-7-deazaguanine synthase
MTKSLVCFSGGIDSLVALKIYMGMSECTALMFYYGQPHAIELDRAKEIAQEMDVPYEVKSLTTLDRGEGVVFPARNLLFAAEAIAFACANSFDNVVFGCNKSDWNNFPDCRPDFWNKLRDAAKSAYDVTLCTPLLHFTKQEVVQTAKKLGLPLGKTWSCYTPDNGQQCGKCMACATRKSAGA